MNQRIWLAALCAGMLVGLGAYFNDVMVRYTGIYWAAMVTQGVAALLAGTVAAATFRRIKTEGRVPWWSLLGGLPAALSIVIANFTARSEIGLSGTLSLMLLGQVTLGLATDQSGLFNLNRRQPTMLDFFGVLTILTGSAVIIFFAG